ncbi:hypothetical protein CRG98_017079 [Punica granatum]|uniref:RanBP2-type domain-containing protein n=1 Tax=Punica granatum TaxID=22663 RepID=A0A2I0K1U7_PUNGR|nr:hypothetical protein CRG98_017079 [Punica granatum]
MNRPGVWNCRSCQYLNKERKETCRRCGDSRSGAGLCYGSLGRKGNGSSFGFPDVCPGDWYCTAGKCGAHNFAGRSSCIKCGTVNKLQPDSNHTSSSSEDGGNQTNMDTRSCALSHFGLGWVSFQTIVNMHSCSVSPDQTAGYYIKHDLGA